MTRPDEFQISLHGGIILKFRFYSVVLEYRTCNCFGHFKNFFLGALGITWIPSISFMSYVVRCQTFSHFNLL
jgi:hypothetical protein